MKKSLKNFYILWSTQSLSRLGSQSTSFALSLWLFARTGSALQTALLSICSYAPYVLVSIFAGALSDRWNKKVTMLVCDTFAFLTTCLIAILLYLDQLEPWHLYMLNALNGLMDSLQAPACDVAVTLLVPETAYQKISGLQAFSRSLTTTFHPLAATSLFGLFGIESVLLFDGITFLIAASALLFLITIPRSETEAVQESLLGSARAGLSCLNEHRLVLHLIEFLAGVNFVASAYDAALPAFLLSVPQGGRNVLAIVNMTAGIAMIAGSAFTSLMPAPKDRARIIVNTMFISLTLCNFMIPLLRRPVWWCIAQAIGYFLVPVMNTNLDVIVRSDIPVLMQGRVYACRNALQFFTIPLGLMAGGWAIDNVFEPFIAQTSPEAWPVLLFGKFRGAGAGAFIFLLGLLGLMLCLCFRKILIRKKQ